MNFITENWLELLVGIMAFAKVVTNLTPTEKDNKIFGWLDTMIDAIVTAYAITFMIASLFAHILFINSCIFPSCCYYCLLHR